MHVITLLLTAATVALAGIGGLYYSYACSVMPGLRATDDATFVSAMSRINSAIQNPVFALSFFGAFLSLAAATVYSWANGLGSSLPSTVALAFYTATLVITMAVNIPLNNRLDQAVRSGRAATARKAFERRWTRWNIHRTWLSLASLVALSASWASLGQA
ncbi:anthrone oxygenase family protein [Pseudarthrobacter sp. CCNWLW207]|uniref:anthrone oxygenase family protein n=1 Tax=Pseudarthrobacter sp. CCNWLW207 TaxID=3127468 RepID=UPI003076CCDE